MIILDENIQDTHVREAIKRWYPGQVLSIIQLRPQIKIKDEAIATLLRHGSEPTFVTNNVSDFWNKIPVSSAYCIIGFDVPNERIADLPALLRDVLRLEAFKTKASRMGKIIRWTPTRIEYYESNQRVVPVPLD